MIYIIVILQILYYSVYYIYNIIYNIILYIILHRISISLRHALRLREIHGFDGRQWVAQDLQFFWCFFGVTRNIYPIYIYIAGCKQNRFMNSWTIGSLQTYYLYIYIYVITLQLYCTSTCTSSHRLLDVSSDPVHCLPNAACLNQGLAPRTWAGLGWRVQDLYFYSCTS